MLTLKSTFKTTNGSLDSRQERELNKTMRSDFAHSIAAAQGLCLITAQKNPDIQALEKALRRFDKAFPAPSSAQNIFSNGGQRNPLVHALENHSLEASEFLLDQNNFSTDFRMENHKGNNIDGHTVYPYGTSYGAVAAQAHNHEGLRLLASHGFDLQTINPRGHTLLDYALRDLKPAKEGCTLDAVDFSQTVRFLMSHGVKFTVVPFDQNTKPAEKIEEFLKARNISVPDLISAVAQNTIVDVNPQHLINRGLKGTGFQI